MAVDAQLAATVAAAALAAVLLCRLARLERALTALPAQATAAHSQPASSASHARTREVVFPAPIGPDQAAPSAAAREPAAPPTLQLEPATGFASLPEEGLTSVLAALPPWAQLVAERVCSEWRSAIGTLSTSNVPYTFYEPTSFNISWIHPIGGASALGSIACR